MAIVTINGDQLFFSSISFGRSPNLLSFSSVTRKRNFTGDLKLLYQKSPKVELSSAASLAQLVERALRKRKVARSTRARGKIFEPIFCFKHFAQ